MNPPISKIPSIRQLIDAARPRSDAGHAMEVPGLDVSALFHTATSRLERNYQPGRSREPSIKYDEAAPPASRSTERIHALSLAVAQRCNLGCTYCYARQGDFGQPAKQMQSETALKAVALLLDGAKAGETATLAFMGGEPLLARKVIHEATAAATRLAGERGVQMKFSITTNGTLLTPADGEFFEEHGFAVTVSLDGMGETHDALRPTKSGAGTYETILNRVRPLLSMQRRMQVSARATVTPSNLELREMLEEFIAMGFHSVGFSPMLSAPDGCGEMDEAALERMLAEMVVCGLQFERAVIAGRRYPFLNMVNAMREIHQGARRPQPCGAAAGYLGVSAGGELAACHRFVGEAEHSFGSVTTGRDLVRQRQWIQHREVDTQQPCRSCWARYLCGGGCHYEVVHRGRTACDFIRGWLHYCLQAYARLREARPDYFLADRCDE